VTVTVRPETSLVEDYEQERGKPLPSYNHFLVQSQLQHALRAACGDRYIVGGELTLATEPSTTPDISVCNFRQPDWLHDETRAADPPITVAEIMSSSQSVEDIVPKIETYFRFGLKQVAVFTSDMKPQVYIEGEVVDPTLDVKVALADIFIMNGPSTAA
jgi:Uma2 family endonuclease